MDQPDVNVPDLPQQDGKDTVTLSVRVTERQRTLLEQAAALRGWKPTNLLRVAALEKAAAIVNVSTPRKTDFKGLARRIAEVMFARRQCRLLGDDGHLIDADPIESFADGEPDNFPPDFVPVEVYPWGMSDDILPELRQAVKTGSSEFLNLILEAAEEVAARNQWHLPDPIDPTAIE